ncbi:MAG: DUF494 family protein [candidate division Zixibacteria bacterium]|nr:DUF494 family protein [candidate division Zixibacteria bacterium]
MINRILEIVVYLIDFFREKREQFTNIDELSVSLKEKGYTETEISSAYSWLLERYENAPENYFSKFPEFSVSVRILTESERHHFTVEAQGLLIKLLSFALIDNEQFEMIVDRASLLVGYQIDVEQVKVFASTVIFKDLDEIDRLSVFESDADQSNVIN